MTKKRCPNVNDVVKEYDLYTQCRGWNIRKIEDRDSRYDERAHKYKIMQRNIKKKTILAIRV